MKVTLNTSGQINNYTNWRFKGDNSAAYGPSDERSNTVGLPALNYANFPNISFRKAAMRISLNDEELLLRHARFLNCAYSGRPLLPRGDAEKAFSKLAKRPNAQSAIHLLQNFRNYMYPIEEQIFDIFDNTPHNNKKDFSDILKELVPTARENLKIKQKNLLNSTEPLIKTLSPDIREDLLNVMNVTFEKVEDGAFKRKYLLDYLLGIKAGPEDEQKINKIYRTWYQLPRPSRDVDAFIIGYAKLPHETIAKRLISSAIATIEHIEPQSRNGADDLSNYLLVCNQLNSERNSIPLDEFILLNPSLNIPKNLQSYVDSVISEVGRKYSVFSARSWYPEAIQKAVLEETDGYLYLDISKLRLTKEQIKENNSTRKLCEKYIVKNK